jgi:hypothetical protein
MGVSPILFGINIANSKIECQSKTYLCISSKSLYCPYPASNVYRAYAQTIHSLILQGFAGIIPKIIL